MDNHKDEESTSDSIDHYGPLSTLRYPKHTGTARYLCMSCLVIAIALPTRYLIFRPTQPPPPPSQVVDRLALERRAKAFRTESSKCKETLERPRRRCRPVCALHANARFPKNDLKFKDIDTAAECDVAEVPAVLLEDAGVFECVL